MTELNVFVGRASAWLDEVAPRFGRDARVGLTEEEDLAHGRAYLAERYEAGFAGIDWPERFGGLGLTATHKRLFELEERRYGFPTVYFGISLGMPVPVIMQFAKDDEWIRARVIAALRGEEIWCQLFSEPAAGSDLAGLRLRAERVGSDWQLTGQKLWTSWAQYSDFGVIVARSDFDAPKHKGLTYFWVDMRAPGITVKPIKLAGGGTDVNEVFFDGAHVPDDQRLSDVGGGFGVAIATLMLERYVITDSAGLGPPLHKLLSMTQSITRNGEFLIADGRVRALMAKHYSLRNAIDAITTRASQLMETGMEPGPEGSLQKLFAVRARQKLSEYAIDLQGLSGLRRNPNAEPRDDWQSSWLDAPIGRIAGGSDETLLNTIAERILGLPQDHRPDKGMPFSDIPR